MLNVIVVGDVGGGSSDDWVVYFCLYLMVDSGVFDVEDKDECRDSVECFFISLKVGLD